jgi:hypothetical protein
MLFITKACPFSSAKTLHGHFTSDALTQSWKCFESRTQYNGNNFAKSPASDAGTGSEPRLMSQRESARNLVLIDQNISAIRAVEVPVFFCLRR